MVPVMMKAQMTPTWDDLFNRRSRWLTIMARLKPGLTRAQAEAGDERPLPPDQRAGSQRDPGAASKSFRERFVAKHLFLRDGQKGARISASSSRPRFWSLWEWWGSCC